MWSNLKKTQAMVDGQVGFHDEKAVRKIRVEKKDNSITNRLTKTKVGLMFISRVFFPLFVCSFAALFRKLELRAPSKYQLYTCFSNRLE